MKYQLYLVLIVYILSTSCQTKIDRSGPIVLPQEWKFQKGDSSIYSNPGFNDQSWISMRDTF